jgi:hypothetical protein
MIGAVGQVLMELEGLDFSGKGEEFVESKFLTPLLECLGYDKHKDYEVIRHGDDGSSFKLNYPPVEKGAKKVKHYHPDYVPTIRKKMFWIIEAKSPKDVQYPFGAKNLIQGLQYCIHPEIQAQYLLVSNGVASSLFDAHGAVFLEKDMFEPILEFRASELRKRWAEIYEVLGVEKLRTRIEKDIKAAYDKLCLSSLDKDYPSALLSRIGASSRENAQHIAKTVNRMFVERMNEDKAGWHQSMEALDADQAFATMDDPMVAGPTTQAHYFLKKSLAQGIPLRETLHRLTWDYERQSLFRKEQSFLAVCFIYLTTDDVALMTTAKTFIDKYKGAELSLLNQVECALLRIARKSNVLRAYPKLREEISRALESAPELVRFVGPPSAFTMTYAVEVERHHRTFEMLKQLPDAELEKMLGILLPMEADMEEEFWKARKKLSDSELQLLGFEIYGKDRRHYSFRGILHNYGIEKRPDIAHPGSFTQATPKAAKV